MPDVEELVEEIEEEAEETTSEETPEPPAAAPSPAPLPAAAPAASSSLLDLPYEWNSCVVSALIVLQPDDGDPRGREVNLAVRTHLDAPIIRTLRLDDLRERLEATLWEMLEQLRGELPQRGAAAQKRPKTQPAAAKAAPANDKVARARAANAKNPAPAKKEAPAVHQTSMFDLWGG